MSNTNTVSGSTRSRGFGQRTKRTVTRPTWSMEVKSFIDLFAAVMRQTGAPRCAQRKYLTYIAKQLLHRGSGFLAQCRGYPIYGLRLLGGDVSSKRSTAEIFVDVRMRRNSDGIDLPIFMGWYWNRLWALRKVKEPTKQQALEVSRILAVLSFARFLVVDSKRGRKAAMDKYIERIKHVNGKLPLEMVMKDDDPLYTEMVEFLSRYGHNSAGKRFKFDRRSYSLKCLVNKKPYRPPVPPVYGYPSAIASLMPLDENGNPRPNNLVNVINRFYYDRKDHDARLCIIAETGGKFRGICPYTSPYAHSVNLHKKARSVLMQLPGNCNFDQDAGHKVGRALSRSRKTKVSVDASNFTDAVNIEYAAYMAKALGSAGSVHYASRLRVLDPYGVVHTGCVPLMGWKGTFDLSSVLLAFSFYKHFGALNRKRVQCGDDYLGEGKLEDYQRCYEFLGLELSHGKTVVAKNVTIFCGKMYWRGLEVTPVRFSMHTLFNKNRFVGKLINRIRDFIVTCNYSPRAKRLIFGKLKRILGERYRGYLDFRLSSELGGIPLDLGPPEPLVPYLEGNKIALLNALCNIPYEKEDFNSYCTEFSHLPLGKPYSIFSMATQLTPGSWPQRSRLIYGKRKRIVSGLLSSNRAGIEDVLLYLYDGTMLRP